MFEHGRAVEDNSYVVEADARVSDDFYVVALPLRKMHSGH